MLILTRRVGESVMIGDDITVKVVSLDGNRVRIGINAPKCIEVHREEVYEEIQRQGKPSARGDTPAGSEMDRRCHNCMSGEFVSNPARAATLICNGCGFSPLLTAEKLEEFRIRAIEALRDAQNCIRECDFSRKGGANSMPMVIGHVRSRVGRACELLMGFEI